LTATCLAVEPVMGVLKSSFSKVQFLESFC
jgi:hypothetical protein